jgi:2-hydroxymuconate-semialdehyde hydrolase
MDAGKPSPVAAGAFPTIEGSLIVLSQFRFTFEDHAVAAYEGGRVGSFPLLLMHGIGPGASIETAFGSILPFLERNFNVFAMDWIGFGRSDRKHTEPFADFEFWVRQARSFLDMIPSGPLCVFGHSLSGAVALRLAATEERVAAVFTTGAVGTRFVVNEHLKRLWTYPQSASDLKNSLSSLIHDVSHISNEQIESRWKTLSAGDYGEYFTKMLADPERLVADWDIDADALASIRAPCTLLHGKNDLACPPEQTSGRLAQRIRHSNLILLDDCGHAPAIEHPAKVCAALRLAFDGFVPFD